MRGDILYQTSSKPVKKYGEKGRNYLWPSAYVIQTAVTKLTLARQLLVKNFYIEFH